jgi:hypothetical protein
MTDLREMFRSEWAAIRQTPIDFAVAVTIVSGAAWGFMQYLYRERIAHYKESLEALDKHKTSLQQRLLETAKDFEETKKKLDDEKRKVAELIDKGTPANIVSATGIAAIVIDAKGKGEVVTGAAVTSPPTPDSQYWKVLKEQFEKLRRVHVIAEWTREAETEGWFLGLGVASTADILAVEALCRLAGVLLKQSGRWANVPDNLDRWLYFLKEREGLTQEDNGVTSDSSGEEYEYAVGLIEDVVPAAIRACEAAAP